MNFVPGTVYYLLHILLLFRVTFATNDDNRSYLLSCGAPPTVSATPSGWDGRRWNTDNNPTFSNNSFSSTIAASTVTDSSVAGIPFSTARIFTSNFTYSFAVSPGPKFIRLYFYPSPSPYSSNSLSRSSSDAYLTVETNSGHLLLRNFSAYLSVTTSSDMYTITKEFYIHVSGPLLQLTIVPTPPNSYAFVNGIEVVSIPENLYVSLNTTPKYVDDPLTPFTIRNSTALETVHRLNVGGKDLGTSEDSGSMSRRWFQDDKYLIGFPGKAGFYDNSTKIKYTRSTPSYSAPAQVYETMRYMGTVNEVPIDARKNLNVTWGFQVDLGFFYLVRLHWCEIEETVSVGDRRFNVYINEQMAEKAEDVFFWAPGGYTAMFRDYVVHMDASTVGNTTGVLQLALHPNTDTPPVVDVDVLLNGLEIYKLNNTNGNLDGPNPSRAPPPTTPIIVRKPKSTSNTSRIVPAIIGIVAGLILLSGIICYLFIFRQRKKSASSSGTPSSKSKRLLSSAKSAATRRSSGGGSSLPSHLCRYFSIADIKTATSDFSTSLIIGHGGFGNVYKGTVNSDTGSPIAVAIKRLNPLSGQGAREFTTEIELLSKLRHLHLVSLIGYCDDAGEMILVYEFMAHGTLRDHLYPSNTDLKTHLPWNQRLEICIGAARGLHYLHTGTDRMIIHRDVKSTNILLDEKWVAKVSDFGLSKLGPTGADYSHVSTAVKGSFGYVDPEYYRRQQLTEKSDVYSFGVVLFEVLCARAAVNPMLPKEQVNLRIWARRNKISGTLDTIVDPTLKGQIAPESLRKFGEVAESCVRDEGSQRPSMADVIWGLEFALQLQLEAAAKSTVDGDDNTVGEDNFNPTNITSPATDTTARLITSSGENTWTSNNDMSSGLFSSTTSVGYGGGSTDVFSQIFKPEGR